MEKREGTDIGWIHGRAGVSRAGEDEADSGEGEHPDLEDGVAGALDDDPEHGHGDDEGEHPFGDSAGVGIDLERGPPSMCLYCAGMSSEMARAPPTAPAA
jgi:hypothetical protein